MTCTPEYLRTTVMISEKLTAEQHNIKSSDELFFATAAVDRYRISAGKEHGRPIHTSRGRTSAAEAVRTQCLGW